MLTGDVEGALAEWSRALTADPMRTEAVLGVREFGFGDARQERLPAELGARLGALRGRIEAASGPAKELALSFLDAQAGGHRARAMASESPESTAKPPGPCTARQVEEWLDEDNLEAAAHCSSQASTLRLPWQLRVGVARALSETGRPAEALNLLAELDLNPNHTGTLFDLGNTYLYERQPQKALEYLKRVDELDPHYPDVHEFLGIAYTQLRNYPRAEAELERAATTDKDGRVHYQLGRVYQLLAKPDEAKRQFAISDKLKQESEQRNVERVQQIAAAQAALRPQ